MDSTHLEGFFGDQILTADLHYGQDCRLSLQQLPDQHVHMVATSPPYWGLRNYGGANIPYWPEVTFVPKVGLPPITIPAQTGALGQEHDPWAFIGHLVTIFREVHRVLRDDGTLWLNLGDSYANDAKWGGSTSGKHSTDLHGNTGIGRERKQSGLKPKDQVGIPWMAAFALQADGWYLRQDIIWHKLNPLPESVTDRCTKAHEYVFLLTKQERYFYDYVAVKERAVTDTKPNVQPLGQRDVTKALVPNNTPMKAGSMGGDGSGFRNLRDVWALNGQPYPGAHFATWPEELVRPMILAGTSRHGCCWTCGAPWQRLGKSEDTSKWTPSCSCVTTESLANPIVMDIFSGSATTGVVAWVCGRHYIGLDQNAEYLKLAKHRLLGVAPPNPVTCDDFLHIIDLFGGLASDQSDPKQDAKD